MLSNFTGTWKLVQCKLFDSNGIEQHDPFYNASGILTYDTNGFMSAQIMKHNHANSVTGNIFDAPADSFKKYFENYIAYYGLYSIDENENIVTHTVLGAMWPNMVETELKRRFEFKDKNTMVLTTLGLEAIVNETPIIRHLTWSRILKK